MFSGLKIPLVYVGFAKTDEIFFVSFFRVVRVFCGYLAVFY